MRSTIPKVEKPEIEVFDLEQVGLFLEAAPTYRHYAYYLTALDAGARPGALLALQWNDVDFEGGFLSITKSVEEMNGHLRVKAPKTAKGRHVLRHTCATLLLLADAPGKVLSERLGHSSIAITLDTYSPVLPAMQKRAANVLGTILGTAVEPARKATR